MKRFETRQLDEAVNCAAEGGQALHVCRSSQFVTRDAPRCFQHSVLFAHLLDQDKARLETTARELGVRVVKMERINSPHQHVDLCGQPLHRAMAQCEEEKQGALAL